MNIVVLLKIQKKKKNDKIFEEWISFYDEDIKYIELDQRYFEKCEEVCDTLNAKILIYKAIKDNN